LLFLILAPFIGIHLSLAGLALACVAMFILSFGLTALGLCLAWRMNSTQGFHAIMNLFLMPLWFLSGAMFPVSGAWSGIQLVMKLNPLTYGLAVIRRAIYWNDPAGGIGCLPGLTVSLLITMIFAVVIFALASAIATGRSKADLE